MSSVAGQITAPGFGPYLRWSSVATRSAISTHASIS
jgi:hypothetical protein